MSKPMTIEDLAVITKRGFDEVDKRFEVVDKRFDAIDERFDRVEFLVTGHDRRMDIIEDKVRQPATKIGLSFN